MDEIVRHGKKWWQLVGSSLQGPSYLYTSSNVKSTPTSNTKYTTSTTMKEKARGLKIEYLGRW